MYVEYRLVVDGMQRPDNPKERGLPAMKANWSRLLVLGIACVCLLSACGGTDTDTPGGATPQPDVAPETLVDYQVPTDINPYTGLQKGDKYPEGVRGVAVMINNVRPAWPQSGLNSADLVYEIVTESGITRLMAVYRDYKTMPRVGPLRSARDQHVQLMLPLQTLYAHIGTSNVAQEYLELYKYVDTKSIDGKYKNFYEIDAERRKEKGQEHCVYTDGEMFAKAVKQYDLQNETTSEAPPVFDFVRYDGERRTLEGGDAGEVYLRFSGYADSLFEYDAETGKYLKTQYDMPQIDMADDGRQYGADNVFVLFANMEKYPDGMLTKVKFEEGQGAGLYFNGGRYERIRWMKDEPASMLRIVDNDGNEIDVKVNPGTSYIAVADSDYIGHCLINGQTLEEAFGIQK